MASIKIVGAIALGVGAIVGCGGADDPAAVSATVAMGTGGSGGASSEAGSSVVCGSQGQPCCASGALCASDLTCSDAYCLQCAAAPPPLTGCTNVARGAVATAGSYGAGPPDDAAQVVDGDVCTSWNYGSYADANSQWQVDLGQAYSLDALTLWPKMTPAEGTVQFLVEHKVSAADAYVAWPTNAGLALTLYDYQPWQTTFAPAITARYVRISIEGTPSFAALREVALFTGCSSSGN